MSKKKNKVIFKDSQYLGDDVNRMGQIVRVEDSYTYEFYVICKKETPEIIKFIQENDLRKYEEFYKNPKSGASTGIVLYENLKQVVEVLNK